jgi:hypothetical protein
MTRKFKKIFTDRKNPLTFCEKSGIIILSVLGVWLSEIDKIWNIKNTGKGNYVHKN